MRIRKHKSGDIGWMISQHGEIYTQEFQFDPHFEIHIAQKLIHFLRKGRPDFDTIWLAEVEKKRAGSIAISRRGGNIAFINFVLVSDEFRGLGIAQTLMETVINYCKQSQILAIELETYDCLVAARKLYAKLGFEILESNKSIKMHGQTLDQEFWGLKLSNKDHS